jgi:phospholipid/cholesterol/gamma-HCH transport system substrate-binding protein
MEDRAKFALIGIFTFAVVAGALGFLFWLHNTVGKKESVFYRVIFDGAVSGLAVGGPVLFNGIRVGEVTSLKLDPDKPHQVAALLTVNKSTPIRSDTRVRLEFTGLTGIASVALRGVSVTAPLIEKEEGEPPTLKADESASQDLSQAVRDTLNKIDDLINENRQAVHDTIQNMSTFSGALARNSEKVDDVMTGLVDGMAGFNKFTSTATRQFEIVGGDAHRAINNIDRAVTDLAHNPQRILFGGGPSQDTTQQQKQRR